MQTPNLSSLKALLVRVEAATAFTDDEARDIATLYGGKNRHTLFEVIRGKGSTDAALAFFEAVLPGWYIELERDQDGAICTLRHPVDFLKKAGYSFGEGQTFPLAIVAAVLIAKIAELENAE